MPWRAVHEHYAWNTWIPVGNDLCDETAHGTANQDCRTDLSEDILNVVHIIHDRDFAEVLDRYPAAVPAEVNSIDLSSCFGRGLRPVVKDPTPFLRPVHEKEGVVVLLDLWDVVFQ